MRFAVFGSTGTLGTALRKVLKSAKFHTRKDWDVENLIGLESFLYRFLEDVDVVINALAYTDVSRAEIERERAYKINVDFPKILAKFCESKGIVLIHISTDYVFDGKDGFYVETDKPNPISWYGKTKAISEEEVLQRCSKSYIIRTSWVFGENGKNFFSKMPLKLLRNEEVYTHSEQLVCPTSAIFLAEMIANIPNLPTGIYHITCKTPLTPLEGTILIRDILRSSSVIRTFKPDLDIRPRVSVLLDTKINYTKPSFTDEVLRFIKTSLSL